MLAGLHDTELTVREGGGATYPVMVPPLWVVTMALPAAEAAYVVVTPIAVLVTPLAIVTLTTATGPFGMMLPFIPVAKHVYEPVPAVQLKLFPAPVAADPAVAEMEVTADVLNVSVHCTAAGSLPEGDVNVKFKATVPLLLAVPEDNARESDCAKRGYIDPNSIASVNRIIDLRDLVRGLFMAVQVNSQSRF